MVRATGQRHQPEPKRRGQPVVRKVFDVTLQQLAEVGFERLSVPDVAAAAGVNKTSVYRRWPTKSDLVRAALGTSLDAAQAAPDTGSLRSDLMAMGRATAKFIESPRGKGVLRLLFAEVANPAVRELASSLLRQADHERLHVVIRRSIRRGELPRSTDANLILYTVAGALVHHAFIERKRITETMIERVVDLVLHGALGQTTAARQEKTART